jgi:predicted DNA-binding antitoxin AbrB/MazE fold protein
MISQPIRAVYSQGQLRLLDSVNLSEGEEVQLMILSDEERVLAALGDLLVEVPEPLGEEIDEEALAREIEEGFRGQSLSDTIIEERRSGQ